MKIVKKYIHNEHLTSTIFVPYTLLGNRNMNMTEPVYT